MEKSPSQQEVDAVAHFVLAVEELTRKNGLLNRPADSTATIDTLAADFYTLWDEASPANYFVATEVIQRFFQEHGEYVDAVREEIDTLLAHFGPNGIAPADDIPVDGVTPLELVDLAFQNRFKRANENSTRDASEKTFQQVVDQIGLERLEKNFAQAVIAVGTLFTSIEPLGRRLIQNWSLVGIQPSFSLEHLAVEPSSTSANVNVSKPKPASAPVIRDPNATTGANDKTGDLLAIYKDKSYSELQKLVSLLSFSPESFLELAATKPDLQSAIESSDYVVHVVESDDDFPDTFAQLVMVSDRPEGGVRRQGMVVLGGNKEVFLHVDALAILSDQHVHLCTALAQLR